MKSIKDKLESILPTLLPDKESEALFANELLDMVQSYFPGVSINSLKQNFSLMSADPRSCLAKRTGKHGYYLRSKSAESNFVIEKNNPTLTTVKVVEKQSKRIHCCDFSRLNSYSSGRLHPSLYLKK